VLKIIEKKIGIKTELLVPKN